MAIFKRETLKEKGLTDEQIDFLMSESGRALGEYIPKSELQGHIDEALKKAPQPTPVDPKSTEEYKAVVDELAMVRALGGEDFAPVKPKFRETVYRMLDHGEKHAPYAEQMKTVAEQYEEYFTQQTQTQQQTEPHKPQFGASIEGTMPSGDKGASFGDYWGFGKKERMN
jgi:hypothetical protein